MLKNDSEEIKLRIKKYIFAYFKYIKKDEYSHMNTQE